MKLKTMDTTFADPIVEKEVESDVQVLEKSSIEDVRVWQEFLNSLSQRVPKI